MVKAKKVAAKVKAPEVKAESEPAKPDVKTPEPTKAEIPNNNVATKPVTEAEKAKLEKEAIAEVTKGLESPDPELPDRPFCPENWGQRYRAALGSYKAWLKTKPDLFVVIDLEGHFAVRKVGSKDIEALKSRSVVKRGWLKSLNKAWSVYCDVVSRENRDFKTFLAVMPEHIRALKAGVKQEPAKKEAEPGPSSTNKRKAEPEKTAKVESATQPPVKVENETKTTGPPKKKKKVRA